MSMASDDFDPDKEKREFATKRQYDHTIDQVDEIGADGEGTTTTKGGQIKQSHAAPGENEASQQKKEKDRQRLLKTVQQLQRQHEELMQDILDEMADLEAKNNQLQHEIDENTAKIETLLEENDAVKGLRERFRNGESLDSLKEDGAYQKVAQAYHEKTGRDPEQLSFMDLTLWHLTQNQAKIAGVNAENVAKAHQITENKIRYEELKELKTELEATKIDADGIEDPVEKTQALQEIEGKLKDIRSEFNDIVRYKNTALRNEQEILQANHAGVKDHTVFDDLRQRETHILNTEAEVSAFMKDYAQAQTVENNLERLAREQDLVGGLSSTAKDQLSFSEETEHLFEEQYFAALEHQTDVSTEQVLVTSGPTPG